MAVTYDPDTDAGYVRLLASDIPDGGEAVFSDEEIAAFLDRRHGDPTLAAATALRVIAGNEAMVLKRMRMLDLDLNGPSVAQALRETADDLERQADEAGEFDAV